MGKHSEYDWIDDPFDDEKNARELELAQRSRSAGCLIGAVVGVVAVVALVVLAVVVGTSVL